MCHFSPHRNSRSRASGRPSFSHVCDLPLARGGEGTMMENHFSYRGKVVLRRKIKALSSGYCGTWLPYGRGRMCSSKGRGVVWVILFFTHHPPVLALIFSVSSKPRISTPGIPPHQESIYSFPQKQSGMCEQLRILEKEKKWVKGMRLERGGVGIMPSF